MWLLAWLTFELATLAAPGLVFYGCIPLMLAAVSLSTTGHKFEYIVAAKPEGANGPSDGFGYKPVSTNTNLPAGTAIVDQPHGHVVANVQGGVAQGSGSLPGSRASSKEQLQPHAKIVSQTSTNANTTESETEAEPQGTAGIGQGVVLGKVGTAIPGYHARGPTSVMSGSTSGYTTEREEV